MDQESEELKENHTRWATMKLPPKIFKLVGEEDS
jgi:hypothetical protein